MKMTLSGLLDVPEVCLARACLRRLNDPSDTLASAEIRALGACEEPEHWLADRLRWLAADENDRRWGEADEPIVSRIARLREQTVTQSPVETVARVLNYVGLRPIATGWGPDAIRAAQRQRTARMDRPPGRYRRRMDRHRPQVLSAPALRMGRRGGRVLGPACSLCQRASRSRDAMRGVLAPPSRRGRAGGGRPSAHSWPCPDVRNGVVSSRRCVNRPCSADCPLKPRIRLRQPDSRLLQNIRGRHDHPRPDAMPLSPYHLSLRLLNSQGADGFAEFRLGNMTVFLRRLWLRVPPITTPPCAKIPPKVRPLALRLDLGRFQIAYGATRCLGRTGRRRQVMWI